MLIIKFAVETYTLYYLNSIANDNVLLLKDKIYSMDLESKSNEGFIGFFDWLRSNDSTIIGIRICYFLDLPYNDLLRSFSYIIPSHENQFMEILFLNEPYNDEISGDQDFSNTYVYRGDENELVFTIPLDHLTEEELESLKKHCEYIDKI